ncbi:glycosyltransferase family 4 protein [Cerasicoccus frondis]|uniref:glycosyltransferase family 4 protein n=1 Tax=Cerasicoccus frondis TaxID=490090 RepID=UPI0028529D31|nr:glycosyltransferase family 4 protein [Cerasicoccus frondis]
MLKVLIVSPTMGSYGGIEAFVLELGRYLNTLPEVSVELCFKLVGQSRIDERLNEILQACGLRHSIVSKFSRELLRSIARADIVHTQNASPDVSVFSRLCGAKLVQTIHNHLYNRPALRTLSWKLGARLAHIRLYNSEFVQKSWRMPTGDADRVVPTVSSLTYDFAPLAPRQGFVFVSRLIENKGAETLLEAYAKAGIPHLDWPLHIVGDGPLRNKIKSLAATSPGNISLHGFVEENRKRELIRGSRWLIAPPHTMEDMGLTPLEARANGIPVIATRDGGLPESAGSHALLCKPGDVNDLATAIETAVNMNEAEYEHRSEEGFASLKRHLFPLDFYPELYRQLSVK